MGDITIKNLETHNNSIQKQLLASAAAAAANASNNNTSNISGTGAGIGRYTGGYEHPPLLWKQYYSLDSSMFIQPSSALQQEREHEQHIGSYDTHTSLAASFQQQHTPIVSTSWTDTGGGERGTGAVRPLISGGIGGGVNIDNSSSIGIQKLSSQSVDNMLITTTNTTNTANQSKRNILAYNTNTNTQRLSSSFEQSQQYSQQQQYIFNRINNRSPFDPATNPTSTTTRKGHNYDPSASTFNTNTNPPFLNSTNTTNAMPELRSSDKYLKITPKPITRSKSEPKILYTSSYNNKYNELSNYIITPRLKPSTHILLTTTTTTTTTTTGHNTANNNNNNTANNTTHSTTDNTTVKNTNNNTNNTNTNTNDNSDRKVSPAKVRSPYSPPPSSLSPPVGAGVGIGVNTTTTVSDLNSPPTLIQPPLQQADDRSSSEAIVTRAVRANSESSPSNNRVQGERLTPPSTTATNVPTTTVPNILLLSPTPERPTPPPTPQNTTLPSSAALAIPGTGAGVRTSIDDLRSLSATPPVNPLSRSQYSVINPTAPPAQYTNYGSISNRDRGRGRTNEDDDMAPEKEDK